MEQEISMATPEATQIPSDKEKKYDRQLRLWGANGQQALEDSHILLINTGSGTVGVEALKNLVLPGIGKFTIHDNNVVTEADLGVNFFLDEDSLGKPRAEACVRLLQELNPEVEGNWCQGDSTLRKLLDENRYTIILYTHPSDGPTTSALVKRNAEKNKVPFIEIHSLGFFSAFRIHYPVNFPIVDTHPESTATTDLRLLSPWPELSSFETELTKDMPNQSDEDHGHIPYIVILLYYLRHWKESHGAYPQTYTEKKDFRNLVACGMRTHTAEGAEENFEEAVAAVLKTVTVPALSSSAREVLEFIPDKEEANTDFWVIASAIKEFYTKHNELPLPGSVPDMKARSNVYVQLQNIYKAKARKDVAEVLETVRVHPHGTEIDAAQVETFCKNAAFIKMIHKTDLNLTPNLKALSIRRHAQEADALLLSIYGILIATAYDSKITASALLTRYLVAVQQDKLSELLEEDVELGKEIARARGGELHNISAFTGGMISQEVIKIITKQYVPIDNTVIFDGTNSRTQVCRV